MSSSATGIDVQSLLAGGNEMLAVMDHADLARLGAKAQRVRLRRYDLLTKPDCAIDAVCFIEAGVASVIKPDGGGERTEIGMLGRESFTGLPLVTADGQWPYQTFVQSDYLRAIRVPADRLFDAMAHSNILRALLTRAAHVFMVQVAEALVSAAWQQIPARLARWLLMYRDRLQSDRIEVTHEFIALMIGAQRAGITLALHRLEGAGMITSHRGLIVIRDQPQLRSLADGSYGVAEDEQARFRRTSWTRTP